MSKCHKKCYVCPTPYVSCNSSSNYAIIATNYINNLINIINSSNYALTNGVITFINTQNVPVTISFNGNPPVILQPNNSINNTVSYSVTALGLTTTSYPVTFTGTNINYNIKGTNSNIVYGTLNNNYSISGTLSGLLPGENVTLQNNGTDNLTLTANGTFTFATALASGSTYNVTVLIQPINQICTISNGSGIINNAPITTVLAQCVSVGPTYTVSGILSGLLPNQSVTLQNNAGDNLILTSNGTFTFTTPLPTNTVYNVTVLTQPINQLCTISNGSGIINNAPINTVLAKCISTVPTYTVGGTLTGLATGEFVILQNNDPDLLTLTTNGSFTFPTALPAGTPYNVTVLTQPNTQTCIITAGTGTVANSPITTIQALCTTNPSNKYTVGGTLSGLASGQSVVLQNNSGDNLTLTNNGPFTFATTLATGLTYNVTVLTQPNTQTCTITNGNGTISNANISNVLATCTTNTYSVGGTLSGLTATESVVLQNNSGDNLTLTNNGPFTFATALATGSTYNVTVLTQPSTQTCTITNGSGTINNSPVSNILATCGIKMYSVGGTLSGLTSGQSVVLQNNSGDNLTLTNNGPFTFATALATGLTYNVTVLTQPSTQTCTITNGNGTINNANISNVLATCTTNTYSVGGTLSGLASGQSVVLQNNGGDNLTLTNNGPFTFATKLTNNTVYNVTVLTQPSTQTCTITNGSGTISNANISNVLATCGIKMYSVGGTLTGLAASESVTLQLYANALLVDTYIITNNGPYVFPISLANNVLYSVQVSTQPATQSCTLINNTGIIANSNITNVNGLCVNNTYTVGGVISNLLSGEYVILQNNVLDTIKITQNGPYTFPTALANGQNYNVQVLTQPFTQTCTLSNNSGTISGANVTNVNGNCVTFFYTVGGMLTGLGSGKSVIISNNNMDYLTLTNNGPFTFSSPLLTNSTYLVTTIQEPIGQTCTITNGSGTINNANVTNVLANCINISFTVGGFLVGLTAGESVTLQNNGVDNLILTSNGPFTFATPVAFGNTYNVTVLTQPITQICTISSGTGTIGNSNITNVSANCVTDKFTVGVTVQNLLAGETLKLANNGTDFISITPSTNISSGFYTFPTLLSNLAAYDITVVNQPATQTCTITNSTGTVNNANVTNPLATCVSNNMFTIYANITGLAATPNNQVILNLKVTSPTNVITNTIITATANAIVPFSGVYITGSSYLVTITTEPLNQNCILSANYSGTINNANITVSATCVNPITDGKYPNSRLIADASGNLYGTCFNGGNANSGVVYQLLTKNTTPASYTENIIHSFGAVGDGTSPVGNLIQDNNNNLYGACSTGGVLNGGLIYKLTPLGTNPPTYSESILHSFNSNIVLDGLNPASGLYADNVGNLYGTCSGDTQGNLSGVVYQLVPQNTIPITYTENIIHFFNNNGDGKHPNSGLAADSNGNLYGTTRLGGANNAGVVYKLTKQATTPPTFIESIIYNFPGTSSNSIINSSLLYIDANDVIYGVSSIDGVSNFGLVYSLTPLPSIPISYSYTILYNFMSINNNGNIPVDGVVADAAGNLYGVCSQGGSSLGGTAYQLQYLSPGNYSFDLLNSFGANNGSKPDAGLYLDAANNIYGTTLSGGTNLNGLVYQLINKNTIPASYTQNTLYNFN